MKKEYIDPKTQVKKSFKSMIGVGISTKDYSTFKCGYEQAIEKTLIACGIKKEKEIYCNYDFNKIFHQTKKPVHHIFFKEISPYITSMNIFYSLFKKDQEMLAWGHIEKELKHSLSKNKLSFDEMLDILNNGFPLFCIWKASKFITENNLMVLSDNFQVKNCDSWNEISDINLKIYHSGDKCNPMISTADILIQLIDLRLHKYKKFYQYGSFREILPEMKNKVYELSINRGHFSYISPLSSKNIILIDKIKHPIIFILKDKNSFVDSDSLKNDEALNPLFDLAYSNEGCIKFYNKSEDYNKIRDGDYFVYFSEEGKKASEFFKKFKKVHCLSFDSISKK